MKQLTQNVEKSLIIKTKIKVHLDYNGTLLLINSVFQLKKVKTMFHKKMYLHTTTWLFCSFPEGSDMLWQKYILKLKANDFYFDQINMQKIQVGGKSCW